ncbi:MAG: FAD-binding oxidoreductase [Gammaproteobacteria bacterium]
MTDPTQTHLAEPHPVLASLCAIVGSANLITGDALDYYSRDVYKTLYPPLAVVRPDSVEQLQAIMRHCYEHKLFCTVRGGGASYTDGYLPYANDGLMIDLGRLNKIIEVNETDAYVTVESGATWAQLKERLDPMGWRTPFWGPFSGLRASIGGALSQHTLSHGTGAYGISAESVLSLDVVTGDGSLLSTGSSAAGTKPFTRYYGPDLTGLFTGDCGTLGVKARVTLPLLRKRPAHQTASFAFADFKSMHTSMQRIAAERLEDTHFALDGALSQGQIAKQERSRERLSMALSILKSSPSYAQGIRQLVQSALHAKKVISNSPYMTHYIVEGVNQMEANSRVQRLREINIEIGQEVPATVPAIVRGMPFAPFFNTLGPNGERWVPLHGILAHSDVNAFHQELNNYFEKQDAELKQRGIWHGKMFSAVGSSAFLYEIALYWPDEITAYHREVVPTDYLGQLPKHEANPEARELVDRIKSDITELLCQHGATNYQLGKAYPYLERLSPEVRHLVKSLKHCLDPRGIASPGNLGLS